MSLSAQILQDSPVGYWPLDEASGTTATDASTYGRNGTISGGVVLQATGPAGLRAMDFNGSTGQINIGDFAEFSSASFTIEGWLAPDTNHTGFWFAKLANNGEWQSQISTDGKIYTSVLNTGGGSYRQVATAEAIPLGSFTHYAASVTAALTVVYVNGVEVARSTTTSGTLHGDLTDAVMIGRRAHTSDPFYFNGRLAHVAFFDQELSAARIKAHYEAGVRSGVGGDLSGLIQQNSPWVYYKLTESAANDAFPIDSSANGRVGTVPWSGGYSFGNSAVVPGTTDTSVLFPNTPSSNTGWRVGASLSGTQVAIEVWLRTSVSSARQHIISQLDGNGNAWALYIDPTSHAAVLTLAGTAIASGTKVLDDGVAHYVSAALYGKGAGTSATVEITVDGVLDVSTTATPAAAFNSSPTVNVGLNGSAGGQAFIGRMSHLAVYDVAPARATFIARYDAGYVDRRSLADQVLADSPVLYWKMQDSAGPTVVDSAGSNRDGTAANLPTFKAIGFNRERAISVDRGSTQYVSRDNESALNPTDAYSVEGWFARDGGQASENMAMPLVKPWSSHTDPHYQYLLQVSEVSTDNWRVSFRFAAGGALRDAQGPGATWLLGQWVYLVATFDGRYGRLYRDGLEVATYDHGSTTTASTSTGKFTFGQNLNLAGGYGWTGRGAHIAFYSKALTPERIKSHYEAGIRQIGSGLYGAVMHDAPVNFWPLSEPSGKGMDLGSAPVHATAIGGIARNTGSAVPGITSPLWQARTSQSDDDGFDLSTGFDLPNGPWTVDGWCVRRDDGLNENGPTMLSKDSNPTRGWVLGRLNNVGTAFYLERAGGIFWTVNLSGDARFLDGKRRYWTVTWDTATYRLYVDTVEVASLASTTNLRAGNAAMGQIGRRAYGGTFIDSFNGSLGFVAVYSRVLSSTRIKAHYDAGLRSGAVMG